MNSLDYPIVSRVQERDTTFLVTELLASSPEFRAWFIDQIVDCRGEAQFRGVRRSVETHGRETDIRVEFDIDETRYIALIENKIDAAFGEQQIPDYHKRADQYIEEGRCDAVIVALLAPANREDDITREHFDRTVSYEEICDQIEKISHDSAAFAEEIFRIALAQEAETDKSSLMARLAEQFEPVLSDVSPECRIETTENRIRIKTSDPDFPSSIWYEIRAKFSAIGTISPGIRVSTTDTEDLHAIYQALESGYDDLPLDKYRAQLAEDHRKKQGMVQWVLEVPGEPDAVSDNQIQDVVDAMQSIIAHYHEPLRTVISD